MHQGFFIYTDKPNFAYKSKNKSVYCLLKKEN